MKETLIQNKEH